MLMLPHQAARRYFISSATQKGTVYLRHVLPAVALAGRQLQQLLKLWQLLPAGAQVLVAEGGKLPVQLLQLLQAAARHL